MRNEEVAERFHEIADMLDILGEERFRSLSYHRAARQLEGLSEDVDDLVRQGRLDEVSGIGPSLGDKVREYVATNRIQYHEELRARFPPGVLDLLRVRGLGPKKVQVLWQQLGITDLETLKTAAARGLLRRVPGFGEKTEENILRGIEMLKEGETRVLLVRATQLADFVLAHLRSLDAVERIEAAGSLRRMKESVGDIDFLVVAKDGAAVTKAFTKMPNVAEVLAAGETKATVLARDSEGTVQLDLRILDAESWGAGLQYFTGSKDHNIRLRTMAERRGLKLNEYGVFRGEERLAGSTEDEVYRALGLPWIPPELREDQGEVDAAIEGRLPKLVDLSGIRGDFHVHTNATDGRESLEVMVAAAQAAGYEYVGISDHSISATVAFGLSAEKALERRDRFRQLNREARGLKILLGTECDILDGGALDYPDEVLKEFDYAIASVHSKFTQPRKEMTARVVAAAENPYVNIMGHPTTRQIGWRGPIDVDLEAVFAAAARAGTALEIDADPRRMDLSGAQARAAKGAGCKLTVDTDAHASANLVWMRFGVGSARRGWLEPEDVVNTWPLERVRTFFR